MLNLIAPESIGKSVNLIYSYKKPLLKCIEEKLWIRQNHRWWSPYEFAMEFGRSWILAIDEETTMKNPYHILKFEKDIFDVNSATCTKSLRETFKNKVDAYYLEGWDHRLKSSIETNKWV